MSTAVENAPVEPKVRKTPVVHRKVDEQAVESTVQSGDDCFWYEERDGQLIRLRGIVLEKERTSDEWTVTVFLVSSPGHVSWRRGEQSLAPKAGHWVLKK